MKAASQPDHTAVEAPYRTWTLTDDLHHASYDQLGTNPTPISCPCAGHVTKHCIASSTAPAIAAPSRAMPPPYASSLTSGVRDASPPATSATRDRGLKRIYRVAESRTDRRPYRY